MGHTAKRKLRTNRFGYFLADVGGVLPTGGAEVIVAASVAGVDGWSLATSSNVEVGTDAHLK